MGGGSRVASQAKSAESKSAGSGSPWLRKSKLSQWSMKPHPALQSQAPWPEVCYLRTKRFGGPCPYLDARMLQPPHDAAYAHGPDARRVFKTHAPRGLFPVADANLDPKAKIVYIARNPKDVCCSLYAHASALPPSTRGPPPSEATATDAGRLDFADSVVAAAVGMWAPQNRARNTINSKQ